MGEAGGIEPAQPTQPMPGIVGVIAGAASGVVLQGRYRLDRPIGRGGMADVWAGEDLLLHRPVAVKLFRFDTPGADRRVDAEMRTLAGLSHPGIVTIYDAGPEPDSDEPDQWHAIGGPYLVMELVDGNTLAERLLSGPLPTAQVSLLAIQLARALSYLHGCGLVHRDIKPANILLQPSRSGDGQVPFRARLTDFGTARMVDSTRITAAGLTIGTANYLSPEQAGGGEVGPAADVYALGLVLLEALTGEVAYPGFGIEAAVARLHRPPHIPGGVGPRWVTLLAAMTADDQARRPTADEVAAEVVAWPDTRQDSRQDTSQDTRPDGGSEHGASPADRRALANAVTHRVSGRTTPRAGDTRPLPTATPGDRAGSAGSRKGWPRPLVWAGAALAAAVALVVVLLLTLARGGGAGPSSPTPDTPVQYPSVSGPVGTHLRELESAVG